MLLVDPIEIQTLFALAIRAFKDTEAKDWSVEQLEKLHCLLKDAGEWVEDFLGDKKSYVLPKKAKAKPVPTAGSPYAGAYMLSGK